MPGLFYYTHTFPTECSIQSPAHVFHKRVKKVPEKDKTNWRKHQTDESTTNGDAYIQERRNVPQKQTKNDKKQTKKEKRKKKITLGSQDTTVELRRPKLYSCGGVVTCRASSPASVKSQNCPDEGRSRSNKNGRVGRHDATANHRHERDAPTVRTVVFRVTAKHGKKWKQERLGWGAGEGCTHDDNACRCHYSSLALPED